MPLGTEHQLSGYTIFAKLGDVILSQTEFISFTFDIQLNKQPTGELIMIDRNGLGISGNEPGTYIIFEFNHVSDKSDEKSSSMICVVDGIEQLSGDGENITYKITFTSGTIEVLEKVSCAYSGTSSNALSAVFSKFSVWWTNSMKFIPLNGSIAMTDSMSWRCISMNMWDQMAFITSKSYRENDYLFWYWDDVNDSLAVSSLQNAKAQQSKYVMLQNNNAIGESDSVKLVKENPDATLWYFDKITRSGFLGKAKEDIKPNTSVVVSDGKSMDCGNVRGQCFDKTMQSMGDAGSAVNKNSVLGKDTPLGKLNVVRPNPNNTHAMYSMAEEIRRRVIANFSKHVTVLIHNNAGPPIGSRVALICLNTKAPTGLDDILDKKYSDVYIVSGKTITYTAIGQNKLGRPVPETPRLRVLVNLISDNLTEDGIVNAEKVIEGIIK